MSEIIHDLSVANSFDEIVEKLHLEFKTGILITRVTQTHQYVLALNGLALPEIYNDGMPLNLSICQHTSAMDFPLVVRNTITHPLLRENRAFAELNIVAYLGAPIHEGGANISTGAICALDWHEREWSEEEVAIIMLAAQACDRVTKNNALIDF